jgi:glycosyltransferase involved in cell wall biosynthesis
MAGPVRVVFFGSYDAERHARVEVLLEGLRGLGETVEECNVPVGFSTSERVELLRRPWRIPLFGARVGRVWLQLWRRSRSLDTPDAVVVGYMGHLDVHLARKLWPDTPLALDHMISVADTARDRRAGKPPLVALLGRIDDAAVGAADLPFVDTEEHLELLTADARARAAVVPIGAPRSWFRPPVASGSERLQVVFFGLFTPLQGARTIARAIARLGDVPIDFHMYGRGQEYEAARAIAADNPNVRWAWVPSDQLPDRVAACDVSLGIFGTGPKALRVVPNKVYQSAAAGCAVVTSRTAPQQRALGDAALYVPPGDAAALADTLATLTRAPERVAGLRESARQRAETEFAPEAVVGPLRERLQQLVARRG